MDRRYDNARVIKATELTVGTVVSDTFGSQIIEDVSQTRHSVVVKLRDENLFPNYPRREAAGVFRTYKKGEDVEVIDNAALRYASAARAEYELNNKA